jgi:hypothetical protein
MNRTLRIATLTLAFALVPSLLLTNPASAQSRCAQIRQAVATYGYSAARRHAMAHYGIKAVRAGDRCLKGRHSKR